MHHPIYLFIVMLAAFTLSYLFKRGRQQLTTEQKAAIFDAQNAQYSIKLYLISTFIFCAGLYILIVPLHIAYPFALLIMFPPLFIFGILRQRIYYHRLKAAGIPRTYLSTLILASLVIYCVLLGYVAIVCMQNQDLNF